MTFPVIKSTAYSLVHSPNFLLSQGTTQTEERNKNSKSEYLKELPNKLRSFDDAVKYPPNQVYIGGETTDKLAEIEKPWYENPIEGAKRFAKLGEIMPEDEFYGLMAISDTFDLVVLEKEFGQEIKQKLQQHPTISDLELSKLDKGWEKSDIEKVLDNGGEGLYLDNRLVGCVKRGHETDKNLTSHIILENIVSKASSVLALLQLGKNEGVNLEEVDYIIETSEEACGDMNQRGGGNFAKAIGEIAGCKNATGSDTRAFCAAPAHGILNAAALVKSGIYKTLL